MPEDADKPEAYIANLTPGVVIGYKYFDFRGVTKISVKVRGQCYAGGLSLMLEEDGEALGNIPVSSSNEWHWETLDLTIPDGVHALYLKASGWGIFSLGAIRLE